MSRAFLIKSRLFLATIISMLLLVSAYAEVAINAALLSEVEKEYGVEARDRISGWVDLMRTDGANESLSELDKMAHANDYFNQVPWLSDLEHWGVEDYWATPVEMLATNGGDCEDYSVGKYFSLLRANFDLTKLRITYVKSLTYNQAHMVLAYYKTPGAEPLILDNIKGEILPASARQDLLPVYSFNGESIWLARGRGKKLKGSSQVSLPRWKELNTKMLEVFR